MARARALVRGVLRRIALALAGLAVIAAVAAGVLDSPLGHRLVADRLAATRLDNGLVIAVGRIEGSLFGRMTLRDLVMADPAGRFMTVPQVDLDWRPVPALRLLLGLGGGLDVRDLSLRRGFLLRAPQLAPSRPDQPILPDFAVRIDRLRVMQMTVGPALAGSRRRIDFAARADVRHGRALVRADGRLGGGDRLHLDCDVAPDADRFVLDLDYRAPRHGLLAGLSGIDRDLALRIGGAGRFAAWRGTLAARADGQPLAEARLDQRAGRYAMAMALHPAASGSARAARLGGSRVDLGFAGTFADGRIDGRWRAAAALGRLDAQGGIDLARARIERMVLGFALLRPDLLPADWRDVAGFGTGRGAARVDGAFGDLALAGDATLSRLDSDAVIISGLAAHADGHWRKGRLDLDLAAHLDRIATGQPLIDRDLAGTRATAVLTLADQRLTIAQIRAAGHHLSGNLVLHADLRRGALALAGRVDARALALPQTGAISGTAKGVLTTGRGVPWSLVANYAGHAGPPDGAVLAAIAGERTEFAGKLGWGHARPLNLGAVRLRSPQLQASLAARYDRTRGWAIAGQGSQRDAGAFTLDAQLGGDATRADIHLAEPLDSAGFGPIDLAIRASDAALQVKATGASRFGALTATVDVNAPGPGADATLAVHDTALGPITLGGTLHAVTGGLAGDLAIGGGGFDGTLHLVPGAGGQGIKGTLAARGVHLGEDRPVVIGAAALGIEARLARGASTASAHLQAQGVGLGALFVGRMIADAHWADGGGTLAFSLAGRRGTRLALQGSASYAADRITAYVAGDYAGNAIAMPRRLVARREAQGWQFDPVQLNFGHGAVIASGRWGAATEAHVAVSRMPLSALDIAYPDLGLGGYATGLIDYRNDHGGAPEGHAALAIAGLTRSGLVLTSRPLDCALVARLEPQRLQVRALAREGAAVRMRLQAVVDNLPRGLSLVERVRAGQLAAQLRYAGPADALWRLAAIDAFDLTGPVGIAADVAGTLDAPQLSGAVVSHGLRAQSAISGSDIQAIDLAGSFTGARLSLARFSGVTGGGGRITGSGTIDFSDASTERPRIDLRIGAAAAELVNRPDMGAVITGPVRVLSDGHAGTIAGRLQIDRARWTLGRTSATTALPQIAVTERNAPLDLAPPPRKGAPWKLLVDARGGGRIDVRGLGLQSEWSADVRLRGDTASPQIFGNASVIRGSYEFAGKRFDLSRGVIRFNGEVPVDPQLDIVATGAANDITATIGITGSAQHPQISFSSTPALPEEELLSRILFGSSIAQISAPEAVQLASALAALRSGGGLDPINRLRGAIGLDRLRVLSADAAIGRGTAIAVGKYLGRRFFIELVTDGHGYSASSIEFRLTRWLSLLGTVSTLYDEQLTLKYSRDY